MRVITHDKIKSLGFLKLLREFNVSLFDGNLDISEFSLLMVLSMNADWDRRHRNFGRVCISNKMLGKIKGLNRNKVPILKKSLSKKGYIQIVDNENSVDVIKINNFDKYQLNPDFGYAKIFKEVDKDLENNTNH